MNRLDLARERCVEIAKGGNKNETVTASIAGMALRSLPMPETKQEPYAYVIGNVGAYGFVGTLAFSPSDEKQSYPLYLLPPDVEVMRKENEQLKALLQKHGLSIEDHDV